MAGRRGIDQPYLDGVSITHGSPRRHVWSYAIGYTASNPTRRMTLDCPCASGHITPAFVGGDYYCESGNSDHPNVQWDTWYLSRRLFDGSCLSRARCCNSPTDTPFFFKRLPRLTKDNLEVRLCSDESNVNENIGLERMELFVR